MPVSLCQVRLPDDRDAVVELLAANSWPFHGRPKLTPESAAEVEIESASVATWWVVDGGGRVGLVRATDLDDISDEFDGGGAGCPLFDIRLVEPARRRGVGTAEVALLTEELFHRYPTLHRIEAHTRDDNLGMQRLLERCGYQLEGRLRATWPRPEGGRSDTLVYGILRHDPRPPDRGLGGSVAP